MACRAWPVMEANDTSPGAKNGERRSRGGGRGGGTSNLYIMANVVVTGSAFFTFL